MGVLHAQPLYLILGSYGNCYKAVNSTPNLNCLLWNWWSGAFQNRRENAEKYKRTVYIQAITYFNILLTLNAVNNSDGIVLKKIKDLK